MLHHNRANKNERNRFMKLHSKAIIVAASLVLASCSGGGPFAGGGFGAGAGAGANAPTDPTSPAYFNQTIGDRVFFAVDDSSLSQEAQATLMQQAEWLMNNPEYNALIEGHADEQGTREYNLALGARRAAAVKEFLVAQGVSPARIRTISYGKERPVALCSDESCYSQNRRAVTVISVAGSS